MPDRDERAIALHYGGDGAPRVVASGRGVLAEKILSVAGEAGVPVRSDPGLADALASLAVGQEVPEEMWLAVAEVLAWAYGLERRAGATKG